jgi:hypothetical protein
MRFDSTSKMSYYTIPQPTSPNLTLLRINTHTDIHPHTIPLSHTLPLKHTYTHTIPLTHSHSLTNSHTHRHPPPHSHTNTHTGAYKSSMNAVLAKEEYNTVWEEVKAFAVRMGRRPRILVAKMGQDGGYCIHCLCCVVL